MSLSLNSLARMAEAYTNAWNSGKADAVAGFFSQDGEIVINRGDPHVGRENISAMAAGFFEDVPDLSLTCDDVRMSGTNAVFVWTFTGHDAKTGNPLEVRGWEEWNLDDDLKVRASRGWYDADDYERQATAG